MTSPVSLMKTGLCGALALLALVGTIDAQEPYPSRPIRLVVGFGAGGPTDIPARFIADKLGDALGQRVIVENKPAASGMVATRDVLSQPRDGYTLLLCTHFEAINTAAYKNVQFKLSDLAPISLIAKYYYGVALANTVPADTIETFVQYEAKQIKILAVSAPERLKNLPDIPTLTEKGIDFVRFGWLGICAGAGTPQPIIERLHRDIVAIVATPEYRAMIEKAGSIAVSSTPDQLNTTITQTLDEVSSSIREFGLQQE